MPTPAKQSSTALLNGSTPLQRDLGLTILRVVVGAIFIAHGAQKFFIFGIPAVAGGFAQFGIPLASFVAPMIAVIELLGGIALVLGLLTRLAALGIGFTMLGAMSVVHLAGGFFLPNGFEYTLALLAANVSIILMGPGPFSLDSLLVSRARAATPAVGRLASRRAA